MKIDRANLIHMFHTTRGSEAAGPQGNPGSRGVATAAFKEKLLQHRGQEVAALAQPQPAPPQLKLEVNPEERTYQGRVMPRQLSQGGQVVALQGLGLFAVPEPGKLSSYLIAQDRLLSLRHNEDGTVSVETRKLELKPDKKGRFKGHVLPNEQGRVHIAGKELDVSELRPGQTKEETVRIDGKRFKVTVRMNEDGSVSVGGERKKNFVQKVGSALNFAAPLALMLPGPGWLVGAAKGVGLFNSAKNMVQSLGKGDLLGFVKGAASIVGNVATGAAQLIANKVSQAVGFIKDAAFTLSHGLGRGFLPVVSNGFNLLSSGASATAALGSGNLSAQAERVASLTGKVAGSAGALDAISQGKVPGGLATLASTFGPELLQEGHRPKPQPSKHPHKDTAKNRTPADKDSFSSAAELLLQQSIGAFPGLSPAKTGQLLASPGTLFAGTVSPGDVPSTGGAGLTKESLLNLLGQYERTHPGRMNGDPAVQIYTPTREGGRLLLDDPSVANDLAAFVQSCIDLKNDGTVIIFEPSTLAELSHRLGANDDAATFGKLTELQGPFDPEFEQMFDEAFRAGQNGQPLVNEDPSTGVTH